MAQETTDEEMAAAWEASVASDKPADDAGWEADVAQGDGQAPAGPSAAAGGVGSERILNQDEIDSLLGFSGGGHFLVCRLLRHLTLPLLHQNAFDQHRIDFGRRHDGVESLEQLEPQAIGAG